MKILRIHHTKTLIIYETKKGKSPFAEWLEDLDLKAQAHIRNRLMRLELGHLGDVKSIGEGLFEIRIFLALDIEYILEQKEQNL